MRSVAHECDLSLTDDITEGRPPTVRVKLLIGREQNVLTHDAAVDTFFLAVQVLPAEGPTMRFSF